MRARGFTLLEMLLVLGLLALLAGAAVAWGARAGGAADLRATARELEASLRGLRGEAIAGGAPAALLVDLAQRRWSVEGRGAVRSLPEGLAVRLVTAQSEVRGDTLGRIVFYPDGTSTGGGLELVRGGSRMLVLVDWLTGRVWVE